MKLISKLVVAAFAASAAFTAGAQDAAHPGYLVDGGGRVVLSGAGECWHTGSWAPAMAIEPCDPTLKPVAAVVAPVAQAAPAGTRPPRPALAGHAAAQAVSFSGDALFAFDKSTETRARRAGRPVSQVSVPTTGSRFHFSAHRRHDNQGSRNAAPPR
jgi:OOP family OmpA-OmpF porin